ncbi:hypothetical protein BP6252_12195 [Coleophoma cylindrospora]|uniref:Uncharacterized protein n=1 Tax=Coleophoma cylindrospora TaxID=1849047 RepID=A0A3D8QG58_9HELO|nr:hypothetical protein BP6252_12195 [Coleophoma cylindrospora]
MKHTGPNKRGSDPGAKSRPLNDEHDEDEFELQSLSPEPQPQPQPQPQFHPSNPFATLSSSPRNIDSSPSGVQFAPASSSSRKILSPPARAHVSPTPRYTTSSPSSYAPLPPSNPFASSIQGQAPISPSYKQFHPSNPFAALVKPEASSPTESTIKSNQVNFEAPFDHHRPIDQYRPAHHYRPVDHHRPVERQRPVDQPRPFVQPRPFDHYRPVDHRRPVDRHRQVDQPRPFDHYRSVDHHRSVERHRQVDQPRPFDHYRPVDRHRQVAQPRPFDHYRQVNHLRLVDPHQPIGNNRRVEHNYSFEPQNYPAISEPPITADSSQAQTPTPHPPAPFENEGSSSQSNYTSSRRELFRESYHTEGFHLPILPPDPAHLRGATPTTMDGDSVYELTDFNPSNENLNDSLVQDTMSTPDIPPEATNQPKKPKKVKKAKKKKKLTKEDMATFGKMTSGLNLEETNFAGQKLSTLEHDDLARLLLSKAIAVKTETTVTYEDAPDAGQGLNAELGVVPNEWDMPTASQNFGTTTTVEVGGQTFTIDPGSTLFNMLPLPGDGPLDKGKKKVEGIQAALQAQIEAEASKHQIPDSEGVAGIKEDLAGAHLPMVAFESEPTKFWKRRKRNNVKKKRGGKKKKLGASSSEPGVDSPALEASRAAEEQVEGEAEVEEEEEGTLVGEEPPADAETEEMAGRLSGITI